LRFCEPFQRFLNTCMLIFFPYPMELLRTIPLGQSCCFSSSQVVALLGARFARSASFSLQIWARCWLGVVLSPSPDGSGNSQPLPFGALLYGLREPIRAISRRFSLSEGDPGRIARRTYELFFLIGFFSVQGLAAAGDPPPIPVATDSGVVGPTGLRSDFFPRSPCKLLKASVPIWVFCPESGKFALFAQELDPFSPLPETSDFPLLFSS